MTNKEKSHLRQLAKEGMSFKEIREIVDCSDKTIRNYIKIFYPKGLKATIKQKPRCIECNKVIYSHIHKRCKSCENRRRWKNPAYRAKIPRPTLHKKGKLHPNFKGETVHGNGYIYVYSPKHPYRTSNNYVLKHRLIMEKHLGRYLKPTEIVHHINGIKDDNRIENLMLFPNRHTHINFIHINDKTFICKYCQKDQRGS